MRLMHNRTRAALAIALFAALGSAGVVWQAKPTSSVDQLFDRRDAMIATRDGTKLFTVILTPKGKPGPLPMLLRRTPYGASSGASGPEVVYTNEEFEKDGYILVFQDIRGRFKSEGSFVMNRPPCAERGAHCVDESSDTWDTIDWLVKNVPNNNRRVGALGISYPGWLTDMTAIDPHPALKAISPQAPMGDTWMGDDFFHQGAFRQSYGTEYSWLMEASKDLSILPAPSRYDTYDWYLSFPNLGALAKAIGADQWPTWRRITTHPAYDDEWQTRSVPLRLTHTTVPTLSVGGWWDQEDMYGPIATYASFEKNDRERHNYLVMGPWSHGQWAGDAGTSLGKIQFGSPTGEYYRREIQARWFRHYLHDGDRSAIPEAQVFDAGSNEWRAFDSWPPKDAVERRLYFQADEGLSFDPPTGSGGFDEYVSDPAHPVPYRSRPVEWTYDARGSRWAAWMTEDQRFVAGRQDVLVWQTGRLTLDVRVAGNIVATLFASTTGSDADWAVKLIDVYPDDVKERPEMGGYQLPIALDIMRGRYYQGWDKPAAIASNMVTPFTVDLHQQAYTFKTGHRIMVQVQSTWFPLYDRNPQTYVPNIFEAPAAAYKVQTHRIARTPAQPSHVSIQVVR
jgi:putative CocE/NonD family hydrolase